MPSGPVARRIGALLAVGTAVVLVMHVLMFGINRLTPAQSLKDFFDVGLESNYPTWWNTMLLAWIALAALIAAAFEPVDARDRKQAWWVIAAGTTLLSVDEAAAVHELLSGPAESAGVDVLPTTAWVIPGFVVALCGVAVLVVVGRRLGSPTSKRLAVALAVYGLGALGVEAFSGWIRTTSLDDDWFSVARITFEEGLEMGACVYAVAVIVDALRFSRTDEGTMVTIA